MDSCVILILLSFTITLTTSDNVRLTDGGRRCAGRVEIISNGKRGTVCDDGWHMADAAVLCRELGCGEAVDIPENSLFGPGSGVFWIYGRACDGSESRVKTCGGRDIKLKSNCNHTSDVGTICSEVRLVGGPHRCSGRVEVLHGETWSTVCDAGFDQQDAEVVCRELGCGFPVEVLGAAAFGRGEGQVWSEELQCRGNESDIFSCPKSSSLKHSCTHDNDVGLVCSAVRLVGGSHRCSGRVEVLHGETWSTVYDVDFDQQDAEVVCRELDCGLPVEVLGAAAFGRGEGQVSSEELQCRGNESQIHFCPTSTSLKHNCSHDSDVGLVCAEARLVGGSRCSGRVEVLHGETWSTVCDADFDQQDAEVVCRELDCGLPVEVLEAAAFGRGEGQVWSEELQCRGNESQIHFCPNSSSLKHNCSHDSDVGVVCAEVRLVGGPHHCSGRVEVLHGGTWSTVCVADFDQQDAEVVCRELGCGLPVEVLGAAAFGRGEGQVWSEELQCRGNESQIHFCPTSSSLKHNCSHDNYVGLVCFDSVRLVDGGSRCGGRVEIFHRGEWGTVCVFGADVRASTVVCGELGCGEPVRAQNSVPGSGQIWMSHVTCNGSERTLKNCGSLGWGEHNCKHIYDAEVICSGHRKSRLTDGSHRCSGRVEVLHGETWSTVCDADFDQQDAEVVCRELDCGLPVEVLGAAAFGRGEGHTGARLVSGLDSCSGRVELQYLSEWGTVCDVSWDMRAASVLCGQLKCGSAVAVLGSDWFGEGSGRIWADVFDCQGNETHLSKCPISSWSRTACSHKQDVGVICSGSSLAFHEGRVRLSGGMECEGELEVYFMQNWRRVLLDSWSESEASVICRQLGCGSVFNFSSSSTSSPEHSDMCVTGFKCFGSEAHLGNCKRAQLTPCRLQKQLSITCLTNNPIRLVGSGADCAGRLEVFHNGSWGTVNDNLWDIKDAQVVCRQLQCGVALSAPVPAQFGPGTGRIWLNEVECEGNETSLWNCRFHLCGEHECGHKDDVGVVCSEYKEIRLTDGCEGKLEVFYNGSWGNVCVKNIDKETASLVCKELNCGRSGSKSRAKARVESASNWLDDLKCRKHDSTLWQCPSSPWAQKKCDNHNEVARIACSGPIWLNRVKCRGNEIHLWDCPHSLKDHTDCSHRQDAGVTCADISVSLTYPSSTITAISITVGQTEKKTTSLPQTPLPAILSISPLVLLVLGTMLFLALVLLVVLFYQNRVLWRVLSKNGQMILYEGLRKRTDVVYEEINRRSVITRTTQRGSFVSEVQNSGYEDVDEGLLLENKVEIYDDAMPNGENSHLTADYDDVVELPENEG
ncbi:hypothetical protein MHYP_G00318590 [Metynnis hypsauchen]